MRVPWRRAGWAPALLLWLAMPATVSAKSDYAREQAEQAVAKMAAKAEPLLARHARLKEQGKLDKAGEGGGTLGQRIATELRDIYQAGVDAYLEAINDGWTDADPAMAKLRETMVATRTQYEACGFWCAYQFGDKPFPRYQNRIEVMRDLAAEAGALLRTQKVDEATEVLSDLDRRLKQLKFELEHADEEGTPTELTLDHPAYKRLLAEVDRLRKQDAGVLGAKNKEREGIDQDVERLVAFGEKHEALFRRIEGLPGTVGTEEDRLRAFGEALELITAFDAGDRPALEQLLKDFSTKYGTNAADIDNKLLELKGKQPDYRRDPGNMYEQLAQALATLTQGRKEVSKLLYDEVCSVLDKLGDYSEAIRVGLFDKHRPKLEMAVKYDPENAAAKQRLDGLAAEQAAARKAIEQAIDARPWKANFGAFQGPGKVDALLASALAWVRAHNDDPDAKCIAIRLVDDWFVFDRDALGQPAHYGLPVEVVWVTGKDKAAGKDLATVFELSMVTTAAKPAPPFSQSAIGGNWWLRASKVKPMP